MDDVRLSHPNGQRLNMLPRRERNGRTFPVVMLDKRDGSDPCMQRFNRIRKEKSRAATDSGKIFPGAVRSKPED